MPLSDILKRSLSGYIFVIPGLFLYFLYMKKRGYRQTAYHVAGSYIFAYYFIGILTMTGINSFEAFSPRMVLIPFVDMVRGPVDTVLNVILFLPLGFFLPLLYKKYHRLRDVALVSFLLSLTIEIVQMFGMGATDINDLITNTVGGCLGYFVYRLLSRIGDEGWWGKFQGGGQKDRQETLFYIAYAFVIMVTIQPVVISHFFQLS